MELVRIRWDRPVDYSLLVKMIIKSQDYENTHLLKKPHCCGFFIFISNCKNLAYLTLLFFLK